MLRTFITSVHWKVANVDPGERAQRSQLWPSPPAAPAATRRFAELPGGESVSVSLTTACKHEEFFKEWPDTWGQESDGVASQIEMLHDSFFWYMIGVRLVF